MSYRVITDGLGARWQVWAVMPSVSPRPYALAVSPEFAQGWLAFEREADADGGAATAPREKRRLAPVPPDWETASEREVVALLAAATRVEPRLPRRTG